jgi:hypothetical protein
MNDADDNLIRNHGRTVQIIAFAMLMAIVMFLGVATIVVMGNNNQPAMGGQGGTLPILSMVAVVVLVIDVPLSFIMPRIMASNSVRQLAMAPDSDTRALLGIRQSTVIISRALLEGVGFLGCIAFVVEMHWLALVPVLVVIALMLLTFPTFRKTREWVESQEKFLEEMRMRK